MRIGIFGGTFDPPHIGHLILAAEAVEQLSINKLLWMIARDPPHKQGMNISLIEDRVEMVSLAIQGNPNFEVSKIDIERSGPHYSLETVKLVKKNHPNCDCLLLIGGDSLHDFPNWHEPMKLIQEVSRIGVMRRPSDQVEMEILERLIPGITDKTVFLDAPLIDISAQNIRERAKKGKHYQYYLPEHIFTYIKSNNLYKNIQ